MTVPFVKKYSKKNSYDKFSVLNSAHPLHEVHNVTFPDHVILTYDFNMSTEYVQQMNQLVEIFNFEKAIFPYKYPGLFSMTTSFLFIFLISKIDKKNVDENKFYLLVKQSYLGRK